MLIVFYISGHGFGHASRDIELIRTLGAQRPDLRVIIRTSVEKWFFGPLTQAPVEVQALETDTGLVQIDSLTFNEDETVRQAARFQADFDRRVATEAAFICGVGAALVIGDIPPLACAAAAAAGVPSMALGNFTWDWIYSIYPGFDRMAPDVVPSICRAYATTTRALRLPLSGGFGPMAAVVQHSLQEMTMVDLQAMAVYLKAQSEKPASEPLLAAHKPTAAETGALLAAGAKVYKDRCETCHGADGKGVPRVYPPLANNQSITMRNAVNPIRIVLNGGFPPSTEGNPRPYGMPPFYQELSDEQVAAVVTYIRLSWGNEAAPANAVEVQKSRGVPVE